MYIDTHAHCYDEHYDGPKKQDYITRAQDAGVVEIYMPNCDSTSHARMMELATAHPGFLFPMAGLHPTYVKENYEEELQAVEEALRQGGYIAVGEIGLDYYWDHSMVPQQKDAFRRQIRMAQDYDLPIVIHSRESVRDCIDMVRAAAAQGLQGVFHCFGGTVEEAREVADMGFYLGVGGVVTYKNSMLRKVVQAMPLDKILLETDAPYLSPVPFRGKRNESSYLQYIAEAIADLKGITLEEVGSVTSQNARALFNRVAVV